MKLQLWFPTAIYMEQLPNAPELNKYLIKHIKQWHKKDKGIRKTNRGGWHSTVDMHEKKEFKPLVKELLCVATGVHREEGYIKPLVLGNMWTNINYPGCFNKDHLHPNAHWTGVYYIQTPKNCGRLHLEDPRAASNMMMPDQLSVDKIPERLWKSVNYEPAEGKLMMFPAYLNHGVNVNESKLKGEKGWRISVSFNFIQQ